jgi:spore coat polysaccharide biosynthesis predicted glycosyltransferase SpsG
MRYVFSGEASQTIGTGHVMRLSAIAEELISRGLDVAFVGNVADIGWLNNRITKLGFSEVEFEQSNFTSNPMNDILILDSYIKSPLDSFVAKSNWNKVVSISDKSTPLYLADLVIHPNISETMISHQGDRFYSGPLYIPFRKSIANVEDSSRFNSKLQILLVGGGTDPYNFVQKVSQVLMNFDEDFEARLFTNNLKGNFFDSRFTINRIGDEFDEYAAAADLIFSTAGTTSLEFVARRMAMGIGCSVENQRDYYSNLSATGVAIPIGEVILGKWHLEKELISNLVVDSSLRSELRKKCKDFIDLNGASRIADLITSL